MPFKIVKSSITKHGEPSARDKHIDDDKLESTETQKKRSVIHALARANNEGDRPEPSNQKIPSFSGFQASLHTRTEKK